jgi:hypothetical protein
MSLLHHHPCHVDRVLFIGSSCHLTWEVWIHSKEGGGAFDSFSLYLYPDFNKYTERAVWNLAVVRNMRRGLRRPARRRGMVSLLILNETEALQTSWQLQDTGRAVAHALLVDPRTGKVRLEPGR